MQMLTSAQMQAMIRDWEGCVLHYYLDAVGVGTIGFGHTGKDVHPGLVITQAQADALLTSDLAAFDASVAHLIESAPTTQQQFDAMSSFAYNLGAGALAESEVLRYHLAGNYPAAAADFVQWDHAGGKVLEGLRERRLGEAAVYLDGKYASVARVAYRTAV
jgi:lysozyme